MLPEVDACKMHPWHDGLSRGSRWVLVRSPATVGCASSPAPRVGVAGRPGKGRKILVCVSRTDIILSNIS